MDASTWGFIGSLAGAVVGASASIITTFINNSHSSKLQEQSDAFKRIERSSEFQRNNLLELQDKLHEAMRFAHRAHYEDTIGFKQNGEWGKTKLSEEVNQGIMITNKKLSILTERIADDELRSDLNHLRKTISSHVFAKSETQSLEFFNDASTEFDTFMQKLGNVLRSNY